MDCSGTVIFGRKRGEIMMIIIIIIACTLCAAGPSENDDEKNQHGTESDLRP